MTKDEGVNISHGNIIQGQCWLEKNCIHINRFDLKDLIGLSSNLLESTNALFYIQNKIY